MNSRSAFGQLRFRTALSLLLAWVAYINIAFATPESSLDSISDYPEHQCGVRAALEPIKEVAWDKREYRHLTLDNNMTIILISDPDTKSESATMAVDVGFMSDPKAVPGLAHFTEHMLFRSTSEWYPRENSLRDFLDQNVGKWSATTSEAETVYNFCVVNGKLRGALDRFAQLFISPLFNQSVVEQEFNAIENEFVLLSQDYLKRAYRLEKSTSDPEHPFSNFGYGNRKTLKQEPERKGIDVLQALREFFENHYSAERMHLVVLGKDSLNELQSMVVDQFNAVPNRGRKVEDVSRLPHLKSSLPAIYRIVPGFERHAGFRVWWQVPGTQHLYREKPLDFIVQLLSLEGKGSIISVLKQKNLATDCISASLQPSTGFSLLELAFGVNSLTISNFKEVMNVVFAYLSMLQKVDLDTLRDNYMMLHEKRLSQLFYSKSLSSDYCLKLAKTLRVCEPVDCIRGQGFLRFNGTLIREYLAYLSPENVRIHLTSPTFEEQADRSEPWFDIKYSVEYPTQFQNASSTSYDVYLPPIVRESCTAPPQASSRQRGVVTPHPPILLSDGVGHRLFYKFSAASAVPRVALLARFTSRFTMSSRRNFLITRLFILLLTSTTGTMVEDKSLGDFWRLFMDPFEDGFNIRITATRDYIGNVLDVTLDKITSFTLGQKDLELFEMAKARIYSSFQAMSSNTISYIADRLYTLSTFSSLSMYSKWYEDLSLISFIDMAESIPSILQDGYWEILAYGDIEQKEALVFADELLQLTRTPLPRQFVNPLQILKLPAGTVSIIRTLPVPGEKNSIGQFCPAVVSRSTLLQLLLQPTLHYDLRDKQQLGYVVQSSISIQANMMRFNILVVSSQYSGVHLAHRVEEFCTSFSATLAAMSEEQFRSIVSSVVSNLEAPGDFDEEISQLYLLWNAGNSFFDMRRDVIAELNRLTLSDLIEFYDRLIAPGASERRVFVSIVDPQPFQVVYDDIYPDDEVIVMRTTNEHRSSRDGQELSWF